MNPISGFLSEHGQLYQRDTSNQEIAAKGKKPMLKLVPPSLRRNGSRVGGHSHHNSSSHGDMDSNGVENLLDLTEVCLLLLDSVRLNNRALCAPRFGFVVLTPILVSVTNEPTHSLLDFRRWKSAKPF